MNLFQFARRHWLGISGHAENKEKIRSFKNNGEEGFYAVLRNGAIDLLTTNLGEAKEHARNTQSSSSSHWTRGLSNVTIKSVRF